MEKKKECQWFVEPKDAHTNEVIVRSLAADIEVSENKMIFDNLKQKHSVYQIVKYSFITELYKDKSKFSLDFVVFYRLSSYGPIKEWKLGEKRRKPKLLNLKKKRL